MTKNEPLRRAKKSVLDGFRANDRAEKQADYLESLTSSVASSLHGHRAAWATSRLLAFHLRAKRFANLRNRDNIQSPLASWIEGNVHFVEDATRTSGQWRNLRRDEADATVRQAFRLAGM